MFTNPTQSLPDAFLHESRQTLRDAHDTIAHCIRQLDDDQLNWRPFEPANSVANLVLHLCGNLRQWVVSGVGGAPDHRVRSAEFSDRNRHTKADLLDRLAKAVAEVDAVIASTSHDQLTAARRIQGFDTTVLGGIFHPITHFCGHAQEIIYITRLQLRDKYQFKFVPKTREQGA
jgi:uncharacterized damage-inducible protein DinB